MSNIKTLTFPTKQDFRSAIASYASKGFQTLRDEGTTVTLSKKKHFNWVLAIILLFVPIIGWIALAAMIMAASRGTEVVELVLENNAA